MTLTTLQHPTVYHHLQSSQLHIHHCQEEKEQAPHHNVINTHSKCEISRSFLVKSIITPIDGHCHQSWWTCTGKGVSDDQAA